MLKKFTITLEDDFVVLVTGNLIVLKAYLYFFLNFAEKLNFYKLFNTNLENRMSYGTRC